MIFALYSQVSGAAARRNRARASRSALPPGLRLRRVISASSAVSSASHCAGGSRRMRSASFLPLHRHGGDVQSLALTPQADGGGLASGGLQQGLQ